MSKLADKIVNANLMGRVFNDVDLNALLDGTPAARYGLVNKAIKKKELIRIRRGLYVLADRYRHKKLSQYFLASRIAPHSYISLESALSYYGWIPEQVTNITSVVAMGRTKKLMTPFGEFDYYQLPVNEYEFLTGVVRIEDVKDEPFLLAVPLRALADYVYLKKIDSAGINYLVDSLRIDIEKLMQIDPKDFIEIKKVYRSKRVLHFIENLKQELKKHGYSCH